MFYPLVLFSLSPSAKPEKLYNVRGLKRMTFFFTILLLEVVHLLPCCDMRAGQLSHEVTG